MTTLQNTRDIWKSHSIAPHEVGFIAPFALPLVANSWTIVQAASDTTLKDFLIENEGKRCVVVLDVRVLAVHD